MTTTTIEVSQGSDMTTTTIEAIPILENENENDEVLRTVSLCLQSTSK